jgi:hypothetical protein
MGRARHQASSVSISKGVDPFSLVFGSERGRISKDREPSSHERLRERAAATKAHSRPCIYRHQRLLVIPITTSGRYTGVRRGKGLRASTVYATGKTAFTFEAEGEIGYAREIDCWVASINAGIWDQKSHRVLLTTPHLQEALDILNHTLSEVITGQLLEEALTPQAYTATGDLTAEDVETGLDELLRTLASSR